MANKYSQGKIYKLENSIDGEFYVGSTTQTLSSRRTNHISHKKALNRSPLYTHLVRIGATDITLTLIEDYPCETRLQLEERERYWIETLKPSLNHNIPTRTRKEYRDTDKAKWVKYNKDYVTQNHERLTQNMKTYNSQYREKNREDLKQRCKTYYQDNKEKTLLVQKEKYNANKEVINAKRREKRRQQKLQNDTTPA